MKKAYSAPQTAVMHIEFEGNILMSSTSIDIDTNKGGNDNWVKEQVQWRTPKSIWDE